MFNTNIMRSFVENWATAEAPSRWDFFELDMKYFYTSEESISCSLTICRDDLEK